MLQVAFVSPTQCSGPLFAEARTVKDLGWLLAIHCLSVTITLYFRLPSRRVRNDFHKARASNRRSPDIPLFAEAP